MNFKSTAEQFGEREFVHSCESRASTRDCSEPCCNAGPWANGPREKSPDPAETLAYLKYPCLESCV